jgi:hypothetical protein
MAPDGQISATKPAGNPQADLISGRDTGVAKPGALQPPSGDTTRHRLSPAHTCLPNFSCSAGQSRSGLNGVVVKRMLVASASALPSAAATGL